MYRWVNTRDEIAELEDIYVQISWILLMKAMEMAAQIKCYGTHR
jgi:hypothetical protein